MSNSQAGQDLFVLNALSHKRNGYFLEIGSNHPKYINNTYLLEKQYGWKGLMVEYDASYEKIYIEQRDSLYVIEDATKIDYVKLFKQYNFPKNMDYLQIDLEVDNGSTINTLELLNNTLLSTYTFSVITFEHDIYRGDFYNTRQRSRDIFDSRGYVRLYEDVCNDGSPFEDWYIHPDSVQLHKPIDNKMRDWRGIINPAP